MYIWPLASRMPSTRPPHQFRIVAVSAMAWRTLVRCPGQGIHRHPVWLELVQSTLAPVVPLLLTPHVPSENWRYLIRRNRWVRIARTAPAVGEIHAPRIAPITTRAAPRHESRPRPSIG
jgi:hypothetical protein